MDDQHGIGTCAEAETSVSVGRGREHAEARCYAQRGAAKICAAGLLLLASVECVGWARLQGTEYRRAQSHRLRRAERKEGLCWRRRPQPTYAHTRVPASPSAQSRHPKTHGKACERIACALYYLNRHLRPHPIDPIRGYGVFFFFAREPRTRPRASGAPLHASVVSGTPHHLTPPPSSDLQATDAAEETATDRR